MNYEEVASRYVEALFQIEGADYDAIEEGLESAFFIFDNDEAIKSFFESPNISSRDKKKSIEKVFEGKINKYAFNILMILIDKDREIILEDLLRLYKQTNDRRKGFVTANVVVCRDFPLSKDILHEQILSAVESKKAEFGVSTTADIKLAIKYVIDPNILGGIIIKIGGSILDASVKRHLNEYVKRIDSHAFMS